MRPRARRQRRKANADWLSSHPVLASVPLLRFLVAGRKAASWRPSGPGYLDLYSGSKRAAHAALRAGAPWALCYELKDDHVGQNLQAPTVRAEVEGLIAEGAVLAMGAGPVCSSFSTAITPPVRSKEWPTGIPTMRPTMRDKVKLGNSMATWVSRLVRLCKRHDVRFWVENPRSSWLWRLRCWRKLVQEHGGWICDYCRFGTPWRKSTFFCTDLELASVRTQCRCGKRHLQLRGAPPGGVCWTRIAEPYPEGVAECLGLAVCRGVGWRSTGRSLNVEALAARSSQKHAKRNRRLAERYL